MSLILAKTRLLRRVKHGIYTPITTPLRPIGLFADILSGRKELISGAIPPESLVRTFFFQSEIAALL